MKLKAFRPSFPSAGHGVYFWHAHAHLVVAQSPEWARVVAAHESLSFIQTEEDRLALHDQLEALALPRRQAMHSRQITTWRNAVVDLGEGGNRLIVFTWNVELDDRTQRYGGWVAHAAPESSLGYGSPCSTTTPKWTPTTSDACTGTTSGREVCTTTGS